MTILKIAAGWYDDGSGRQRWWDGLRWTEHCLPERPLTQLVPIDRLPANQSPPGWYVDGNGVNRWWSGNSWGEPAQTSGDRSKDLGPLTLSVSPRRLVLLGTLCGLFTVGGLMLLTTGDILEKFGGLLCIAFFGVLGFIAVRKMWRQRATLTLTREGIRIQVGGFIPWSDFEDVGIGRVTAAAGTKIIGIRLNRYDRYIGSFSPEQLHQITRAAKWGKAAGFATLPFVGPDEVIKVVATQDLSELSQTHLLSIPQNDLAGMLKWSRDRCGGWDVTFSPFAFDRSPDKIVHQIVEYHEAVVQHGLEH